jgi:hypothetical protein
MNDNWWAVGEAVRSRLQEIHALAERARPLAPRSRGLEHAGSHQGGGPAAGQCADSTPALCC